MIAAKIGQRYLIIKLKIFFLLKVPSPRTTSSSIFFSPITLEIRRHVVNCCDRHHHGVSQEVKEIKELHSDDLHTCQVVHSQGMTGLPRTIMIRTNNQCGFLSAPFQFILEGRYCTFCQGNGACQCRTEHQYKKQNTNLVFQVPYLQRPSGS